MGGAFLLHWLEGHGVIVLAPPFLVALVMLAIAAVVGKLGWNVRQYVRGKRPGLNLLLAARTAVLAKAASYTGALLTGWYGAHALVVVPDLDIEARHAVMVGALVAVAGAVVLSVVGLVVERWCEVPPSEGDNLEPGPAV